MARKVAPPDKAPSPPRSPRRRETVDITVGPARVDRRTKDLTKRLQPGDIAVIDHEDLDRVAAEALVRAGVAGVVNAAVSITGRYPNAGPITLAASGVTLVDGVGSQLMELVIEGQEVRLAGPPLDVRG